MKKVIPYAWNFLLTLCIVLTLIVVTLEFCSYDMNFFKKQYESYQAAETIGTDMESLMKATDRLQGYLKGTYPDLNIVIERNGEKMQFFNEREKDHMVDVLVLFKLARIVRNVSLTILIAYVLLCAVLKLRPFGKIFYKTFITTVSAVVIIGALAALVISINFDAAWTFMHTIVFSNDLWLLDPNTDMLINLVPLEFFIAITSRIGIILLCALASIFGICVWRLLLKNASSIGVIGGFAK